MHLLPGKRLPSPLSKGPFRCLAIVENDTLPEWRDQVSEWIIASGCLYACVWGEDCEDWHDRIEWASLEANNFDALPDDRHVMTTWHANEPLQEAMSFAATCAFHPTKELQFTLLLHISAAPHEEALCVEFASIESGSFNLERNA